MIALYIIGGILVLFLLLLFVKISICISFVNDLQVKIKILFLRIKVYPLAEKETVQKKAEPTEKKRTAHKKQKPPKPQPPLKETLLLLKDLIIKILEKFSKYVKLEEYKVKVLIATDDPAKTGILYGVASGILGSLSVVIDRFKRRTHRENRIYTEVKCDFLAEEPELSISAAFSFRVWQLLSMGITASKGFLRYNSLRKEKREADKKNKLTQQV